jgi:dienelactone hydrolase
MSGRNGLLHLVAVVALAQPAPQASRRALDLLLAEKYPDFIALLSPVAKEKLTPEFLRDHVGPEIKGFGKAGAVGNPVTAKDGANTLVSFPVQFEHTPVNIQFTLNGSGQVAGLYFRPVSAPLPALWNRPSYSAPDMFREREVTVGADPWKLGGTLVAPAGKGKVPAVVLVHGPGALDRDETIYSNRIFRDLAEGLASRGIAVLRYDKRTKIYGDKMGDMDFTIQDETVDDALNAIALLRRQPEVDPGRVYVLGHSLGGYISPRIAARDGKLAGLIFLAANARPIEDVALEQNEYMVHMGTNPPPEVLKRLDELRAEVAKVKQLQAGKSNPMVTMGLPSGYLLDLKGYDPAAEAKGLTAPMLFLQGQRDFQVTMKDFGIWKGALGGRKNATFHSYPALNHLFIAGEGQGSPAEYRKPGNVDGAVVSDIATFVLDSGR